LLAHPSIKVAAVTDHNTINGIKAIQRLAAPYPDILIIPGVEITTFQGDIVILGCEELPPKPWTVESVVDFSRQTGSVSIAAHPFREFGLGEYVIDCGVDAIEVLNGGSPKSANKEAQRLAKSVGLPGVGGSDSHRAEELFSVYTEVQSELDLDEILKAVRLGLVVACQSGTSIRF
jgi:predicted metal-dependent phosphoesterase TrpH